MIETGKSFFHILWLRVISLYCKLTYIYFFKIPFVLRYKDESDYALKFMESSWKDVQKEEARR